MIDSWNEDVFNVKCKKNFFKNSQIAKIHWFRRFSFFVSTSRQKSNEEEKKTFVVRQTWIENTEKCFKCFSKNGRIFFNFQFFAYLIFCQYYQCKLMYIIINFFVIHVKRVIILFKNMQFMHEIWITLTKKITISSFFVIVFTIKKNDKF